VSPRSFTGLARGGAGQVALPRRQVVLLALVLGVASAVIAATMPEAAGRTVLLLGGISVVGLVLCRTTQDHLGDPSLRVLGYLWMAKIALTLLLLYVGWIPQLDYATSPSWGYDPQRYYAQSLELIDQGWSSQFVALNYKGILFYYAGLAYVFGKNPVVPALVNAFVTLLATLYLVRTAYEARARAWARDWTICLALLLPELLWFDVMTSRETLMAALLIFLLLTVGRSFARPGSIPLYKFAGIVGLSLGAIAAVRTSMLLPVGVACAAMALLVRSTPRARVGQAMVLGVLVAAILVGGPALNEYLHSSAADISDLMQAAISGSTNIASRPEIGWSSNSIGLLLLPEGPLQAILFLPIRMVLYLLAPLPNLLFSASELTGGSWMAWQALLTVLSSLVNILIFPYAIASAIRAFRARRTEPGPAMIHAAYWAAFMGVAGGNLIIHERYRLMTTTLLWACAWLGARSCSRRLLYVANVSWYGLLGAGTVFYVLFKYGRP
jgi:hypothetical protein